MAAPVCSTTSLVTNAACYTASSISPNTRKALLVYGKALELAGIGGTDYTAVLSTTLVKDAVQLVPGITPDEIAAARVNMQFLNATSAGASVPATLAAKMAIIKCLMNLDPATLEQADLLLTCKLGVHKAYVQ